MIMVMIIVRADHELRALSYFKQPVLAKICAHRGTQS